jgi:hypothetical protein
MKPNLRNVYHLFATDSTAPRYLASIRAASRLDAVMYGRDILRLAVVAVKAEAISF